jgi:hypothetical protein
MIETKLQLTMFEMIQLFKIKYGTIISRIGVRSLHLNYISTKTKVRHEQFFKSYEFFQDNKCINHFYNCCKLRNARILTVPNLMFHLGGLKMQTNA